MDTMVGKTPVSLLHEMCTRKNITPKYDLLQVEGAVHEPIFQYRLTLIYNGTEYEESGTGRSKKEAKHNTARAMLKALNVTPKDIYGASKYTGQPFSLEDLQVGPDGDLGGNPVGILQELCMKMKLPPPNYDVHSEEGLPHERLFAIACRVGENHLQIGRGKSKKLAKRMAAHLMTEYLKALPVESATHHVYIEDDEEIAKILSKKYQQMKISDSDEEASSTINPRTGKKKQKKISIFEKANTVYRKYADWEGSQVELLQDESFVPENPVDFLLKLGEELVFKVMVIEFDEKSSKDKYQCVMQLSLDDPCVFFGESVDRDDAKSQAALQAIEYFKLMVAAASILMEGKADNRIE